jgi:hypothetical protein
MVRRFQRADAELKALDARTGQFERDHLGRLASDNYSGGYQVGIRADLDQPDPDWSLDSGDIVNGLRCCLDYLVYQIAANHQRQAPPAGHDQFQFPIYSPGRTFDPRGKIKGWVNNGWVSRDLLDWLQSVQPEVGTDFLPLQHLADLSNWDKHRRVAVVAVGLDMDVRLVALRDVTVLNQPRPFRGIVVNGQYVGWARIEPTGPDPEYRVEGRIVENVVFGEPGPSAGEPVGGVLHGIRDVVERVILDGWRRFFGNYWKRCRFSVEKAIVPTITIRGGCGHWRAESITRNWCDLVHDGYADHEGYETPEVIAEANP